MLGLLVVILVGCVVLWAAQRLLAAFGIGDPIATVVYVVVVVVILIAVLNGLGLVGGLGSLRLR